LPRKLLLRETGKTVIQHTYESAARARLPAGVLVAADHEEIAAEVRRFGGQVVMTDPECASGTDRVAEVAAARPEFEIFVNVQGDEPEIEGDAIDLVVARLAASPDAVMATLATPIRDRDRWQDPACVKVVLNDQGRALYFSRSPIPHPRVWDEKLLQENPPHFLQHIGIYAYRRDFLLRIAQLPRSDLEQLECLEQLRVLSAGYAIEVGIVAKAMRGIDTPNDYGAFVSRMRGG
jgi:3-deoxy-manno-octulosonate cytidylyltransferase (CMP-KDO synthetase)